MSLQTFKTISYCVGHKHYSGTKNINGKITYNKQTGKDFDLNVGQCSICGRKKYMIFSDNTIQAKGFSNLCNNLGKKGFIVSKKLANNVLNNPGRVFDLTANIATAAASRSLKIYYQR